MGGVVRYIQKMTCLVCNTIQKGEFPPPPQEILNVTLSDIESESDFSNFRIVDFSIRVTALLGYLDHSIQLYLGSRGIPLFL